MEEDLSGESPERTADTDAAANYSPLVLAYMGDAVYEYIVRDRIVRRGNSRVNQLHREAVRYVRAAAQAKIARHLEPLLTEREAAALRRGRNAHSRTMPKNASMIDYRMATAFEALLGYLWLAGEKARAAELVEESLSWLEREEGAGSERERD